MIPVDKNLIIERYNLAMERISLIEGEEEVRQPLLDYFQKVSAFIGKIKKVVELKKDKSFSQMSIEDHKDYNRSLYEDIIGDNYETSYANPAYAVKMLGSDYGGVLSFLYTELRGLIVYAYEERWYELTIYLELYIEIYNYFEREDDSTYKYTSKAIYNFMHDNCDLLVGMRIKETLDPDMSFAKDIIMKADLKDLAYLYQYGDYITDNETKTAEYLNSLSDDKIKSMADTFTEGFRRGFINNGLDLSKKKIVNVRYQIGFERMVREIVNNFREMGLESVIYRAAYNAMNKYQHLKVGYHATSPNKQYDYDHRYDIGYFYNKKMKERKLECLRNALKDNEDLAGVYAGPSLIEVFGEELFAPEDKKEAYKLSKEQQKLYVDYYRESSFIQKEYMKTDETSFTIISYPVPEIGEDFQAIFEETVKVNTLDSDEYEKIQQHIIDTLDKGTYVKIEGAGDNKTDLKIMLQQLANPDKETNFENCIADVNIPVGEVFTSPKLEGTEGILHVPRIYLNDLEYKDLDLRFVDGKVTKYSCKNFDSEENSKSYIKENLLYNHDSLPIGEFAIGTNTRAYMMGKKYDIAARLPILIAEKTGPHFALGDTCYKMSEDNRVYNPDGKEIIAKDNEVSILRKSEPEKAYFNCHTDITLPYDEIKEIAVYNEDGHRIPIVQDGRFVLEGTRDLNKAFDLD